MKKKKEEGRWCIRCGFVYKDERKYGCFIYGKKAAKRHWYEKSIKKIK
jgi:hypothetical protein